MVSGVSRRDSEETIHVSVQPTSRREAEREAEEERKVGMPQPFLLKPRASACEQKGLLPLQAQETASKQASAIINTAVSLTYALQVLLAVNSA